MFASLDKGKNPEIFGCRTPRHCAAVLKAAAASDRDHDKRSEERVGGNGRFEHRCEGQACGDTKPVRTTTGTATTTTNSDPTGSDSRYNLDGLDTFLAKLPTVDSLLCVVRICLSTSTFTSDSMSTKAIIPWQSDDAASTTLQEEDDKG
ncbi:hypothetical protein E2C01_066285 [Portunus trituberculatus]|uniref:Uncharacterized protein n=1 Tax=Portunus trituberculatus TaxID=210409 RepID=A0A5B7HPC5_PORTR|nr:hypothetical protein [Portunus trituberculatus]